MRDGTIMPQPGLTQMASAAGSGDGDWPFLWPRLTGTAKAPGDPVFIAPPAACSTMKTILPRFALGFRLVQGDSAAAIRQVFSMRTREVLTCPKSGIFPSKVPTT